MQTGGCGRKTTSSFRYFDVVLVKWKLRLVKFRFWQVRVSFLPPVFHCSIQTSPTLHFVHLRALKKLMERIASMERGGADATPLISRRFAFSFVLHATRHSKCGGDCR